MKVKVAQACPTLCDPIDYILHGILQARILAWVAVPSSRGSSQPRDQTRYLSPIAGGFFMSRFQWLCLETEPLTSVQMASKDPIPRLRATETREDNGYTEMRMRDRERLKTNSELTG